MPQFSLAIVCLMMNRSLRDTNCVTQSVRIAILPVQRWTTLLPSNEPNSKTLDPGFQLFVHGYPGTRRSFCLIKIAAISTEEQVTLHTRRDHTALHFPKMIFALLSSFCLKFKTFEKSVFLLTL